MTKTTVINTISTDARQARIDAARSALRRFGITAHYKGFPCLAEAVALVMENEQLMQFATVNLYPELAKRYHTNSAALLRNFRTIIDVCWKEDNRQRLNDIAGWELSHKPTSSEFIDILSTYLMHLGF